MKHGERILIQSVSLCTHVHTRVHVYRSSNRSAARMYTNPILPCVSSARRPRGKKSILYLAEHWEPVFQVISVCRTKLNSPATQVGGRAALAAGRDAAAELPGAPAHTEDGLQHSRPRDRGTSTAGKGRTCASSTKA